MCVQPPVLSATDKQNIARRMQVLSQHVLDEAPMHEAQKTARYAQAPSENDTPHENDTPRLINFGGIERIVQPVVNEQRGRGLQLIRDRIVQPVVNEQVSISHIPANLRISAIDIALNPLETVGPDVSDSQRIF